MIWRQNHAPGDPASLGAIETRGTMKTIPRFTVVATLFALAGCGGGSPNTTSGSSVVPAKSPGKVYSLEDVSQELAQAGVQLNGDELAAHAFFKEHSAYHVCKDVDGAATIAVMRNRRIDPKADDQYIVIAYRGGKVSNLDIGPPQFSAGNVASYCP
jgi:hypothetical protein